MVRKNCNLCANPKLNLISKTVRDSKHHKILQCTVCAHIQLFPIPSYKKNRKFYDEDKMTKNIPKNSIKITELKSKFDTEMNIKLIKKIIKPNDRILEIGSGYGFFLHEMKQKNYNITGIEISKSRRDYSQKISNAPVFNYDLMVSTPKIDKFDVVLLFHVLEYIADPVSFLKHIKKLLKPNGKIIIKSPNSDDFQLRINKYYKNWFWQRAHINYFSPNTIKLLLKKSHFTKIKISGIQRYSVENLFSWKLNHKPQINNPTHHLTNDLEFLDNYYKEYLEKNLISDTFLVIAKK